MRVYVDVDIAVKFARWGMLRRFVVYMTKSRGAELYTVSTLRYRFRLNDDRRALKLVGSQAAREQLREFVAHCKAPTIHNAEVAKALVGLNGIDAGEAALFAAVAHFDAAICDTGDKVALRALGAGAATYPEIQLLIGKIACLEQTLLHLMDRWTYAVVAAAVATDQSADLSSLQCFGHGKEQPVRGALTAKVTDLMADCHGMLGTTPFDWKP